MFLVTSKCSRAINDRSRSEPEPKFWDNTAAATNWPILCSIFQCRMVAIRDESYLNGLPIPENLAGDFSDVFLVAMGS